MRLVSSRPDVFHPRFAYSHWDPELALHQRFSYMEW
jgi:hypothetical protein